MFTNADDVVKKSAKNQRTALQVNVVSYHYTNDAKTVYEIRLDGKTVLATGKMMDTDKRRGFSLNDGKTEVYFRTMAEVRQFVKDGLIGSGETAKFSIKLAK